MTGIAERLASFTKQMSGMIKQIAGEIAGSPELQAQGKAQMQDRYGTGRGEAQATAPSAEAKPADEAHNELG